MDAREIYYLSSIRHIIIWTSRKMEVVTDKQTGKQAGQAGRKTKRYIYIPPLDKASDRATY